VTQNDPPKSPLAVYREYCARGELAHQVRADDGGVVFFPRSVAPGNASPNLEWRVSKGFGAVEFDLRLVAPDTSIFDPVGLATHRALADCGLK
jgi:hypothetical protein